MAKLTAALLVCFAVFGGSAVAQEQPKPKILPLQAQCDQAHKVINIVDQYSEELLFTGEAMTFGFGNGRTWKGGLMFFVNQDTGTWTAVQLFQDGIACMVMNGGKFDPFGGTRK